MRVTKNRIRAAAASARRKGVTRDPAAPRAVFYIGWAATLEDPVTGEPLPPEPNRPGLLQYVDGARVADLIAEGLDEAAALDQAAREFGRETQNPQSTEESA